LLKDAVLFVDWKFWVAGCKTSKKMFLEGLDGSLGGIVTMDMWRDALEGNFVFCKGIFEFGRSFIIKDMMFWCNSSLA